jgi:DNA polymerase II large subunit
MVAIKKVENKKKPSKTKSKVEKKKTESDVVVTKKPKSEKKEKKEQLQVEEVVTTLLEQPEKAALSPEKLAKLLKRKEKRENKKEMRSKLTATEVPEALAEKDDLTQAVKTVTKAFAKERNAKNVLFDDDTQLLIQIQAVKYPTVPKRMVTL